MADTGATSNPKELPAQGEANNVSDQQKLRVAPIPLKQVPANAVLRSASVRTFSDEALNAVQMVDIKDFNVILKDPVLCAGLRKFLQQTFCEENLDFYKRVELFKQLTDEETLRAYAL